MRLNSLHNALYVAAKLLRAELVAVKLLPSSYIDWKTADVAVGETSKLQEFDWIDGNTAPNPDPGTKHTQSLFGVDNALTLYPRPQTHSLVAAVTINETLLEAMPGQFLLHERRENPKLTLGTLWIAIAFEDAAASQEALFDTDNPDNLSELVLGVCSQAMWSMYRSAMLQQDTVTGLPGASELQHKLHLNLAQVDASADASTLLILLEIDNFSLLRRQLGSSKADTLLVELASSLRQTLRKNDGLFRFSDAIFAVTANIADGAADQILDKLTSAWRALAGQPHFTGVTKSIGFTIVGTASSETVSSVQQLLFSTELALTEARATGGNKIIESTSDFLSDQTKHSQHVRGVFTSDPMKDYRNSRILWHTTTLIAAETSAERLSQSFITLLLDMMSLYQADIFVNESGEFRSLTLGPKVQPAAQYRHWLSQCVAKKETQSSSYEEQSDQQLSISAVPLLSRDQVMGALLIEAEEDLDDSDLLFLTAIADQIAGALDRLELAERQEFLNARESASLRAEIQELKSHATEYSESIEPNPIVAISQPMRDVLAYIGKVAPTDASILIMGESGAGKEVMAKAIVEASHRAQAPLVTVDCSAIAHSLIDSELFGRVKGAFTGADDASPGRIAQADGGTLFLDEIGELPMDVQAKLLRFVQEKELIAVGDTRRRRIDTRIICATNRDLLFESSQGRFRSDLYYRLQVLQVTIPPLRERQADLPALAESFMRRYSQQFGKSVNGFSDSAWQKISHYHWPGNVRELQNAILRATLTAEHDIIDAVDLQFGEELPTPEQSVFTSETLGRAEIHQAPQTSSIENFQTTNPVIADQQDTSETDDWSTLTSLLAGQVSALVADSRLEAPIGRWLADTVVLTAARVADGVARQAARLLGIPETTLRRQLTKARQNEDNPFQLMSQQWLTSLPALTDLLENLLSHSEEDTEFAEHCQVLLLQQVANHIGNDRKAGAALMGITPPTYARWLVRHSIEPQLINSSVTTSFKLEQKYS